MTASKVQILWGTFLEWCWNAILLIVGAFMMWGLAALAALIIVLIFWVLHQVEPRPIDPVWPPE